jgi:hypothetical protein
MPAHACKAADVSLHVIHVLHLAFFYIIKKRKGKK